MACARSAGGTSLAVPRACCASTAGAASSLPEWRGDAREGEKRFARRTIIVRRSRAQCPPASASRASMAAGWWSWWSWSRRRWRRPCRHRAETVSDETRRRRGPLTPRFPGLTATRQSSSALLLLPSASQRQVAPRPEETKSRLVTWTPGCTALENPQLSCCTSPSDCHLFQLSGSCLGTSPDA
jgi:hypothetical protein